MNCRLRNIMLALTATTYYFINYRSNRDEVIEILKVSAQKICKLIQRVTYVVLVNTTAENRHHAGEVQLILQSSNSREGPNETLHASHR